MKPPVESTPQQLQRVVGLPGAITLGLGSILGTGVFISLLFAVQIAGEWAVVSVAVAALLAVCNGLSSAQLAASHPVSGGAYEYGYRYLTPALGFNAGWMFLLAKGASAATAALAFSEGLRQTILGAEHVDSRVLSTLTVVAVTALVLSGVRRSVRVNAAIVSLVLVSLGIFAFSVLTSSTSMPRFDVQAFSLSEVLQASALCFVAYTGYGRVATMGEEIRDPARNIPRAVIATLVVTFAVYVVVAATVVIAFGSATSDSVLLARSLSDLLAGTHPDSAAVAFVRAGAMLAMFGVLLNLVLGLSRVVLAMSRRGDLPGYFATLSSDDASPQRAVVLVAVLICALTMTGDILRTWSMSAFAVLIYYATANLCALRQPIEERRYPRIVSIAGLLGCLCLAPCVDQETWYGGLALIAAGLIAKKIADIRKQKCPVT